MCGINGLIGFSDAKKLMPLMDGSLRHRGPDAGGEWFDEAVALGHRRLSIIDISAYANQPMVKDGLVIVYNGEVYNYQELKEELIGKGIKFETKSDTEVILELFRAYRQKSFDKLLGMFAFAIYDLKNKEIFLVRDYFGIKPLYYAQFNKGQFAFSSELKALFLLPGFNKEINPKALVSSLNYLWIYGNDTIFKGVKKLPPAHYFKLRLGQGGILESSINRYWKLSPKSLDLPERAIEDKLKSLIENTVKRHLISDVPVGAFLSGGLDSSLVSVLAKRSNQDLKTYTISISKKDKRVERMPQDNLYAQKVARIFNIEHRDMPIEAAALEYLEKIVSILEEPIGDPAAINTYLICKTAWDNGIKVLLSGMGADEIFAGYRRHSATLLAQELNTLPQPFKAGLKSISALLPVRFAGYGLRQTRWLKRFFSFTDRPLDLAYMRSYSYYDREELFDLCNHNFSDEINQLYSDHREIFYSNPGLDDINKMCNTDINMFMAGLNLFYTDKASMATSVEVRVPYIDRELIEFAMSIKGEFKINKGTSKYLLRKVALNYLPREIVYRPKASFGMPIRSWISCELKSTVDELLSEASVKKRGILNYALVKEIITDDRKGIKDNAYQIYQLLTLELWFRKFIDGK